MISPSTQKPMLPPPGMGTAGGSAASTRFAPVDPIRVLRQYQHVLLLTAAVGMVLGVGLWVILLFAAPRFQTTTQLRITGGVESGLDSPGAEPRTGGNMDTIEAKKATEMAQLMSNFVIDSAINELRDTAWFQQYVGDEGQVDLSKAREDLQDALRIFSVRNSFHFQANLRIRYRYEAQRILDTVVTRYLSQIDSEAVNQAAQVRATWVRQRDNLNRQIESIQQDLRLFTQTEEIESLDARANSAALQHQALATRVMEARFELARLREAYGVMQQAQRRGEVLHDPTAVAEVRLDPSVNQREERVRLLREQRGVSLDMFGPNHRQVKALDRRLIEVEQELQSVLDQLLRQRQEVQLEQYAKGVASYEEQVAGLESQLEGTRTAMMDLAGKQERYQQLKTLEARRLEELRSLEAALSNQQAIAERPDKTPVERMFAATEPKLVFPMWYIVPTMTTILAVGLVLGLVLLIEMSDQRLKGPSDVSTLPGAKPLGMIPDTTEDPSSPAQVEGVVRGDPTGLMAESFRQVRTALVRAIEKIDARTVMFTCGQAQAGVTALTGNLADGLALIGRRVLVIDANFRRPGQHKQFSLPLRPGLADVLAGQCAVDAAIKGTGAQSVSVLTAGACAGAEPEMLERPAFGQLLRSLRERYDVILIDTPPVSVGSEAKLVARQADAVVVVARALADERGMIARVIRDLDDHKAQLLGIILNRARASTGGYFRKNFEAFYRYRQQEPGVAPTPAPARTV